MKGMQKSKTNGGGKGNENPDLISLRKLVQKCPLRSHSFNASPYKCPGEFFQASPQCTQRLRLHGSRRGGEGTAERFLRTCVKQRDKALMNRRTGDFVRYSLLSTFL